MKKMLKKFATIGACALIAGTALGSMGCSEGEEEKEYSESLKSLLIYKDVPIVLNENGVGTLHKGSEIIKYFDVNYSGKGGYISVIPVLKFNCGRELATYQFTVYYQGCPAEDKYDVVCDCAREMVEEATLEMEEESVTSHSTYIHQDIEMIR